MVEILWRLLRKEPESFILSIGMPSDFCTMWSRITAKLFTEQVRNLLVTMNKTLKERRYFPEISMKFQRKFEKLKKFQNAK
jgi:hypothetical protein